MLYTFGYGGRTLPDLVAEVARLKATVIDVRFMPFSKHPVWGGQTVRSALGARYRWVREWGNENYKGGPVKLLDFAKGLQVVTPLLDAGTPLILLCVCPEAEHCHRRVVAEQAALLKGLTVEHLHPTGPAHGERPPRPFRREGPVTGDLFE